MEPEGAVQGPARVEWELEPLKGIGPLWFGIRDAEVAAALPGMTELRRFQGDSESLGVEFGPAPGEPAVVAYFYKDRLYCVAADAAHGPQVTLWGRELTACIPADLERFLLHAHGCGVTSVSYGPRGNPGANGLGLVLRVQEIAGRVVTRPVMIARAFADRCTDDWEGAIPQCEWEGRQWAHSGHSEHWCPPGCPPNYFGLPRLWPTADEARPASG
ncbi:hypothetical protein ACWEQL_28500 [Kitasatospora sp. NPDC004240]